VQQQHCIAALSGQLTAFGGGFVLTKVTVKSHDTEMLRREQIMKEKAH